MFLFFHLTFFSIYSEPNELFIYKSENSKQNSVFFIKICKLNAYKKITTLRSTFIFTIKYHL